MHSDAGTLTGQVRSQENIRFKFKDVGCRGPFAERAHRLHCEVNILQSPLAVRGGWHVTFVVGNACDQNYPPSWCVHMSTDSCSFEVQYISPSPAKLEHCISQNSRVVTKGVAWVETSMSKICFIRAICKFRFSELLCLPRLYCRVPCRDMEREVHGEYG